MDEAFPHRNQFAQLDWLGCHSLEGALILQADVADNRLRNGALRRGRGPTPNANWCANRSALGLGVADRWNAVPGLSLAAVWLAQQPWLRVAAPGTLERTPQA